MDQQKLHQAEQVFQKNLFIQLSQDLTRIDSVAAALSQTTLSTEQQQQVTTIQHTSSMLLALLDSLADIRQMENGTFSVQAQPFNLHACFDEVMSQTASYAPAEITFLSLVDPTTPIEVIGDKERVSRLLLTLLYHALSFTPSGVITLQINPISVILNDKVDLQLTLHSPHIHVDKMEGFICQQMAEALGGELTVDSQGSVGTTFQLTLPLTLTTAVQPEYSQPRQAELLDKRVLLVNHNSSLHRYLRRLTRIWGMEPVVMSSALLALDAIRKGEQFDCAIIDYQLPYLDGLTLWQHIQRHHPEMLVIMITTRQFSPEGFTIPPEMVLLSQPFALQDLYQPIQRYFRPSTTKPQTNVEFQAPLTIMLAEDNQINQRITLHILKKLGYSVDLAVDGKEVLTLMEQKQYDVILMDLQMPEMDGITATRAIRERWPVEEQPVIVAVTADGMINEQQQYRKLGMDYCLAKPLKKQALTKLLQDISQQNESNAPQTVVSEFDLTNFYQAVGYNSVMARNLINKFLEIAPQKIAAMGQAIAEGDGPTLNFEAHTFKSNSALFGAKKMANLAAHLEQAGRTQQFAGVSQTYTELTSEYERIRTVLEAT